MGTEAGPYLLSASSGVPNILALIFFRCFLTATFMASSRSPGTRWSVSSSLQRRRKGRDKAVGMLRIGLDPSTVHVVTPFGNTLHCRPKLRCHLSSEFFLDSHCC